MNETTAKNLTPIEAIDDRLKNEKNHELYRGVLVAERAQLFAAAGFRKQDFTADTANRTGICVSTVRRLRRIGSLPPAVRAKIIMSKIVDRQDLLVWLADTLKTVEPGTWLEITQDLIDNPPKYGPRYAPKAAAEAPSPTKEAATPEPGKVDLVVFEGLPVAMDWPDGQPRIHDVELGRRLGYARDRDIRPLIKDLVTGGFLTFDARRGAAPRGVRTVSIPSGGYWLTEEQAIFVTTQSGTPSARAFTLQLVRTFMAARRYLAAISLETSFFKRIYEGMNRLEDKVSRLASAGLLGSHTLALVPKLSLEDAGYSMASMNEALIAKGWNISVTETAVRSIAARLKIIGDPAFGFWNRHNDSIDRGLSESWRFNERGMQIVQGPMLTFCTLKATYEAAGDAGPRDRALKEALDGLIPVGEGTYTNLTRDSASKAKTPFPGASGPVDNG